MRTLIRIILWTWFLAALIVGGLGLLRPLPSAALSGLLLGLTALLLATSFGIPDVRAWLRTVDLRALVLLHVSRLIGYAILFLYRQGRLPYALAVPGGWGDIIVAVLALAVVVIPMRPSLRHHAYIIWNTIGLMNVLLLTTTVVRLGFVQPWQLGALRLLPCSMLPTFLIPLIITTHVIIFERLRDPADLPDAPTVE
jgi:hypothetical protein